jgi:hypothetical protein
MLELLGWLEQVILIVALFSFALTFIETYVTTPDFKLYSVGITVINGPRRFNADVGKVRVREVVETANGDFKFINSHECLFRNRWQWRWGFLVRGPFLKGRIRSACQE